MGGGGGNEKFTVLDKQKLFSGGETKLTTGVGSARGIEKNPKKAGVSRLSGWKNKCVSRREPWKVS